MVAARAAHQCEYCQLAAADTFFGCQVDHIISEKHGGQTEADNLAYACVFCNRFKGSDIASLTTGGELTRLFHPRRDAWKAHFHWDIHRIAPLTPVGEVTVKLLGFNLPDRLLEREVLRGST